MKNALLFFALFLLSTTAGANPGEFRTLTNSSGQAINAKPVSVVGKQVRIQREDGQEFNVSTDMFVAKDRQWLEDWMLVNLAQNDRLLKITPKANGTRKMKTESGGIETQNWEGFYKITFENMSELPLNDLRIEYRFYKFDDQLAAQKRSEGDIYQIVGELKVDQIEPRKKIELETAKIKMQESEVAAGYYLKEGGAEKSKDKLEGIRMKIYRGKLLLYDFAEPTSLREKYEWK